jgi:hypothetical protein
MKEEGMEREMGGRGDGEGEEMERKARGGIAFKVQLTVTSLLNGMVE